MEAPLSSPSLAQPSQYFQSAPPPPPSTSASQSSSYTSQPGASSANPGQQAHQSGQQQQQTQTQRGVTADANTASPFLRDFNLVAEAAKRAQMAVLMRDMEAVGL